uniref:Uncharacterized protein n=1 Tax=Meloidogyne enterolobii TaxID=390850 RepID=A0A6V7ULL1_MELEN|nr:unnamed protein product [Meloidogyne enterolobii]
MKLSPMELMFRLQFCLVISQNVQDLLLLDVAPLSLGIETAVGVMTPVPRCYTDVCFNNKHFLYICG